MHAVPHPTQMLLSNLKYDIKKLEAGRKAQNYIDESEIITGKVVSDNRFYYILEVDNKQYVIHKKDRD